VVGRASVACGAKDRKSVTSGSYESFFDSQTGSAERKGADIGSSSRHRTPTHRKRNKQAQKTRGQVNKLTKKGERLLC
jgi:hypothetical protein